MGLSFGNSARASVARAVGIGAVKYADLSKHRVNDYLFDWDQMLSFDGNTAPYLQYACTRIRSIFRRVDESAVATLQVDDESLSTNMAPAPEERALALQLVRFAETLDAVAREGLPHYLCSYLHELAGQFMKFYENCPVLGAPTQVRRARLTLCASTDAVLARGLQLLGIATVERM